MKVPIFPDFGLFRVGKWEYERILLFLKESGDFGDLGKSPSGNWNSSKRGFSILARSRDWGIPRLTLLFFSPFFRSFSAEETQRRERERVRFAEEQGEVVGESERRVGPSGL